MVKPIEYHSGAVSISTNRLTGIRSGVPVLQLDLLPPWTTRWTSSLTTPAAFHELMAAAPIYALKRFPFRIVFRNEPHRSLIVAIAHAKRRPGYWHGQ